MRKFSRDEISEYEKTPGKKLKIDVIFKLILI